MQCHLNQHTEFIHTAVLLFQSSKVEPEYLDMSKYGAGTSKTLNRLS